MDETLLKEILASVKTLQSKVDEQDAQIKKLAEPAYTKNNKPSNVFIRKGEDVMGSRGYSFLKLMGVAAGVIPAEKAKLEVNVHNKVNEVYKNMGFTKAEPNTIVAPFSTKHLSIEDNEPELVAELRDVICAGVSGYDPEEVRELRMKHWGRTKAMSWIDETTGGSTVAPPMMGELIELFRNNEALMAAGARDIGMPPQGRITFPRQTGASTAYFVGESVAITDSTPGTGDLVLSAKKLGVLVKIPNELFRFATISIEQFIREDISRVMALRLDKELLEGAGSAVAPKGLINYAGIQTHTASSPDTNGDRLEPQDIGAMVGKVEERNANFTGWIMRPRLYGGLLNRRADAITAGDSRGPFVFNMFRDYKDNFNYARGVGSLEGYKAVKTTQIANDRVKAAGTDLTYLLGGDFTDYIMALGGLIEFTMSNVGDTPIANDQTWVRGIQYVDGAPRHEASFIWCDDLVNA